ncbi:MAG TPA: VWA domain-containing protein [Verrucomicrobiae bacterium]
MNWSFGASPLVVTLAIIIFASAALISYLNWKRSGRQKTVAWLETLRLLLVALLGFTLLRPEVVQVVKSKDQPEVHILVDRSASMATRDVQTATNLQTRAKWIEQQLTNEFWKPIVGRTRIVIDEFGGLANTNSPATNSVAVVGTDLNAALERPLTREANLKAVLLLTDGDWNIGGSPLRAAAQYRERGVPVFAVGVGSETPLPDVALTSVTPPSYGLFGEQITIPFTIRSHLTNDVKTTVVLNDGTREEVKKEIVIPARGILQDTVLWYPRNVGDVSLTLRLPVQPGELIPENNEEKFRVSVRVEKLQVLVVDSLPRWEYRYLRNALARDPGVQVHSILFHPGMKAGGGRDYLPAFPNTREAISRYDVIFIGDVGLAEGELSEAHCELIRGLVEQQSSGLIFLPGSRGRQLTLADSPLKDLLPVILDSSKPNGQILQNEAVLTLTTAGKGHFLTRFEADDNLNAQLWQALPGFYWSAAVEKSRPGAEVLAVHSSLRNASGRMPLLATRSAGTGKILFMGTDSAWRWRRGVEDKYHYRFWSQVVRWMAHQRHLAGKEGVRLAYSPERPEPNDTVFLQSTVLDSAGFPAEQGPVTVSITSPSGRAEHLRLTSVEGGWGVFKSQFKPSEAGRYKLVLDAPKQNRKLETELTVQQRTVEEIGKPINRSILAEISALSGGHSTLISGLEQIVQQITVAPEPRDLEKRIRIWSSPWWGGLILTLLSIYWVGRKASGML